MHGNIGVILYLARMRIIIEKCFLSLIFLIKQNGKIQKIEIATKQRLFKVDCVVNIKLVFTD